MKVFVVSILCAVLSGAACGAVGWHGAIPFGGASYIRSVIPSQLNGFGYTTSQYINSFPAYTLGYQPQPSYQIPVSYYPQQTFTPIVSQGYYPSLFYPTLTPAPISPIASQPPQVPSLPDPVQGDEDSAIVDSAEFPGQQNSLPESTPAPQQPSGPAPADEPALSPPGAAAPGNDEDTVSIESA